MPDALTSVNYDPPGLWADFFAVCGIPHPSHHEERLADWLVERVQSMGIEASKDSTGNVLARKPAYPGMERRKGVILQAHIDMVCQAESGSTHDFLVDPIVPRLDPTDPDWLTASGTSLGADNGIGVAAALAVLADPGLRHGPLECLFTVGEEDGMVGARGLQAGILNGHWLLNLDSEMAGKLTIGCAGGIRTESSLRLPAAPPPSAVHWVEVAVHGLLGGHSGVDITLQRGNATILLCQVLHAANQALRPGASIAYTDCGLAAFEGGTATNAIPREAKAVLWVADAHFAAWHSSLATAAELIRNGLVTSDPGFTCMVRDVDPRNKALAPEHSATVLSTWASLPDGLQAMDSVFPGVARTSSNVGIAFVRPEGEVFMAGTRVLVRSSDAAESEARASSIESSLAAAGFTTSRQAQTLPWSPQPDSELVRRALKTHADLSADEPDITVTHGGLECALFRISYPDISMISFGPTIRFPHSPDERVYIPSVKPFWLYLLALLAELP
jgi:dipeptidase D